MKLTAMMGPGGRSVCESGGILYGRGRDYQTVKNPLGPFLRMTVPQLSSQRPSAKQVSSCERVTRTFTGWEQGITFV